MTIKQAKNLLGKYSNKLTDDEIQHLIEGISALADLILEKVEDFEIQSKMTVQNGNN